MAQFGDMINKFIHGKDSANNKGNKNPQDDDNKNEDGTPNFIKLDNALTQQSNTQQSNQQKSSAENDIKAQMKEEDGKKLDAIIAELRKSKIRPLSNQQRNLDREEGGIEHENKETENHVIDEWDNRIEEVQAMAKNINPNLSSAKKSMFWNLKRKRMHKKANEEAIQNLQEEVKKSRSNGDSNNQQQGSIFDSSKEQSFMQKINALRKDRTDFKDPSKIR